MMTACFSETLLAEDLAVLLSRCRFHCPRRLTRDRRVFCTDVRSRCDDPVGECFVIALSIDGLPPPNVCELVLILYAKPRLHQLHAFPSMPFLILGIWVGGIERSRNATAQPTHASSIALDARCKRFDEGFGASRRIHCNSTRADVDANRGLCRSCLTHLFGRNAFLHDLNENSLSVPNAADDQRHVLRPVEEDIFSVRVALAHDERIVVRTAVT